MMTSATPNETIVEPSGWQRGRTGEASGIVFFGTVAWIAYIWLLTTIAYAIVIFSVGRWGSVETTLWQPVASNWQRYVVFGAGVTISTTFLRMLVRNGATRRMLSVGATVTMTALAAILAMWNVAGYTVEKWIYDANGWPQGLRSDDLFAWSDLPRVALDSGLIIAAYFVSGWIVGIGYHRWGPFGGTLRLLPGLVPAVATELLVDPDFGGMQLDVVTDWLPKPGLAVTAVAGGAVLVAAVIAARRLTRNASLH